MPWNRPNCSLLPFCAQAEAKESAEKPADDDKEEVEEESQFVRRASFRLKALRDSQRKKPDRLSFK